MKLGGSARSPRRPVPFLPRRSIASAVTHGRSSRFVIQLVLTVCLAAAPTTCKEERPFFDGSLLACATQGQLVAARWISEHPAYTLNRGRCEPSRRRETPI